MLDKETAAVLFVAGKGADDFVAAYYRVLDSSRALLPRFYRAGSAVLWNGAALSGAAAVEQHCLQLPASVHEVIAYDCQPIPLGGSDSVLLVTVSGVVSYAGAAERAFSQELVLTPDPDPGKKGTYFVGSDTYRLVS